VGRYRACNRAGWILVRVTAVCGAVGLAIAGHPEKVAAAAPYAVLVGAAATAIAVGRRQDATASAVEVERRRIARNLHDGLAQELAYIKMETARLAVALPGGRAERVALAAERALEESRGAIAALRGDVDGVFSAELSELADELTSREGVRLSLQVEPGIEFERGDREELLRIMREAISNGLRHGRATEVVLELTGGDGVRMAVRDNGSGFVPGGRRRRESLGLTSMRERARALGGDLIVESAPGAGTLVEVRLP
jgi:signal transduction histidine kinase